MTDPLDAGHVRALLLDIEGTTTPVDFVTRVLLPYAREHVRDFLIRRAREVRDDLALLFAEHEADRRAGQSPPPWDDGSPAGSLDSATAYVHWLMDRDRKSTALKSLQGRIWEEGYRAGHLRGQVYPDVPRAFARWRAQGRDIAIFSSGSVLAQKLLFSRSEAGDLTPLIRAHFDTTTGAKGEAESYRTIARALGQAAEAVLFLSDVSAELDAARAAGMATGLCVREASAPTATDHPVVRGFDEVLP
ncbi:MAG TPA: acireductone synthase [Vicinamibacteria bacterium]